MNFSDALAPLPDNRPLAAKLPGLLVTGTDTEVGKTLIAGAICRSLRKRGLTVEPYKPVASGCRRTPAGLVSEDGEFLAAAAESRRTLDAITPVRYAPAVAPNLAAARAKESVDIGAMLAGFNALAGQADAVVVEGVGGLLCPISDEVWLIHLAAWMQLPVVIVTRADLGTINHTLLTLHAAASAGLNVAGVIVNRYRIEGDLTDDQAARRGDSVLAMHTNPEQIARLGRVKVLAVVPDEQANSVSRATIGPDTQFAIDAVAWPALLR